MFNRLRTDFERGRVRGENLAADMARLVVVAMLECFVIGLAIGLVVGGLLVWLMK